MTNEEIAEYRRMVSRLEDDLHERVEENAETKAHLEALWTEAKEKSRTADTFGDWLDDYLTQVAVAWVLTGVFVRFLEDNGFVRETWFAGEGKRREQAEETRRLYFQEHRAHSDTQYILHVFAHLAELPAGELFGKAKNALWKVEISGDAGKELLAFWQKTDPDTGELERSFGPSTDRGQRVDTRFLGDLYQDLSESARKKYALLQTPDFVEEYILDYTLEPAIETFSLDDVRFVDPTCGSGHFLLGGFHRIHEKLQHAHPDWSEAERVRHALNATNGVDINPFAVAIARFRLLIAALQALNPDRPVRLDEAPELPLNVGTGDSLLHGKRFTFLDSGGAQQDLGEGFRLTDQARWSTEDDELVNKLLGRQYHAVVGNPPYIAPKDAAARDAYRAGYLAAYGRYALVCPFYERFFELAGAGRDSDLFDDESWPHVDAGFVGQIVANSFTKREFGSKLIEAVIPHTDLTHVIDTSGAYIPGHGTPTIILFGRNRMPTSEVVRAVLGIRGEPKTPDEPRNGKVWRTIAEHSDHVGYENDFVTVTDLDRALLHTHPWSLRGGGALEAKSLVEGSWEPLETCTTHVGITAVTGEDDLYILADGMMGLRVGGLPTQQLVIGESVRDWDIAETLSTAWTYDQDLEVVPLEESSALGHYLWPARPVIRHRKRFGTPMVEKGLTWYEWQELYTDKLRSPLTITFAFVATHNHFALDRGGRVFKQTAPVIKLPADASEDDHLGLLSLLNSSTACFWLKSVCFEKGGGGEHWEWRYEHDGTKVKQFPLTEARPLKYAKASDTLAQQLANLQPTAIVEREVPHAAALNDAREQGERIFRQMVALQEELDWRCYELYGLLDDGETPLAEHLDNMPEVRLGERAFEIVMARKMEAGDLNTTWFERHGSTPITEVPDHWPDWYRELVERRIALIAEKRFIRLIEQPEYKRRWNRDGWEDKEQDALRNWLLDRLESPRYVPQADRDGEGAKQPPQLFTTRRLADIAQRDEDFMTVAERWRGNATFDVHELVKSLILPESAPYLPSMRYKGKGIRKRKDWEKVWELQRREDAGETVDIPKPPKYNKGDFANGDIYKLRGKLDVPKERFTTYPDLSRDGDPVISWAGLDHRQRAQALAEWYNELRFDEGWDAEALAPALAGLLDLLPWVKQWHNEFDPSIGVAFGDYLADFIEQEARELGITTAELERTRL